MLNNKFITKFLCFLSIFITLFFLFAGAYYILNGEIYYISDIARDFLIAEEINEKHIVLIGPRASAMQGMFHGPLWVYLQQVVYIIGDGNPIYFGYFWIFLSILFTILIGFVVYRIFGKFSMMISIIFASATMIEKTYQMINPHGALILMPALWYVIVRFFDTLRFKYIVILYIILGAMIQFQMAVGVPFFITITMLLAYYLHRENKLKYLFSCFMVIPFFLPWVIFDIRHDFNLTQSVLKYFAHGNLDRNYISFFTLLESRFMPIIKDGIGIFIRPNVYLNIIIAIIIVNFLSVKKINIKDNKYRAFCIAIYLYLSFFILSIAHNGLLLYQYCMPIIPLSIIIFSSIFSFKNVKNQAQIETKRSTFCFFEKICKLNCYQYVKSHKIYTIILLFAIVYNIAMAYEFIFDMQKNIKDSKSASWKFHKKIAEIALSQDKNSGYFIYAPDFYGYQLQYALYYQNKLNGNPPRRNKKTSITYVIAEQPPKENAMGLDMKWWVKNKLHISSNPVNTIDIEGYKILKYKLTKDDLKIQSEEELNYLLYYR